MERNNNQCQLNEPYHLLLVIPTNFFKVRQSSTANLKLGLKTREFFVLIILRNSRGLYYEFMHGMSGVSFERKFFFIHCFLSHVYHRKLPKVSSDILF